MCSPENNDNFLIFLPYRESRRRSDPSLARDCSKQLRLHPWRLGSEPLRLFQRWGSLKDDGPAIIAVNPRSMFGSKIVKQAYGVAGGSLRIGSEILTRATLSDEFATASGHVFDNNIGQFSSPHPDARTTQKCKAMVRAIETVLAEIRQSYDR